MIISIVGNVKSGKEKINKFFGMLKPKKLTKRQIITESQQKNTKKFVEKKKTLNSYMVLGYKSLPRLHKDSYIFDVITAILGRGQSGWIFDEIRNKRGLAYQVGINNESEFDYGMFAVYAGLDKNNIEKAKDIILQQFRRLENLSKNDLNEAKTYIEGNHTLQMEDNFHRADNIAYWETIKDAKLAYFYLKSIKKVTINDIKRVAKKYLNRNYTMVVIEQE